MANFTTARYFPQSSSPQEPPQPGNLLSCQIFPVNPASIMAAPVNSYGMLLSIWIRASFKAEVKAMDEASLSNSSSSATTSQKLSNHYLGQLVAKPDDPTKL